MVTGNSRIAGVEALMVHHQSEGHAYILGSGGIVVPSPVRLQKDRGTMVCRSALQ